MLSLYLWNRLSVSQSQSLQPEGHQNWAGGYCWRGCDRSWWRSTKLLRGSVHVRWPGKGPELKAGSNSCLGKRPLPSELGAELIESHASQPMSLILFKGTQPKCGLLLQTVHTWWVLHSSIIKAVQGWPQTPHWLSHSSLTKSLFTTRGRLASWSVV